MANDIKNENENHVLKPLPPVIKNIVNKNHVLKPYPPVPPVSFPKEKKKEMPVIERFSHRAVMRQWFIAYKQTAALNRGDPSAELEKKIIDKIIKEFQELRTIL